MRKKKKVDLRPYRFDFNKQYRKRYRIIPIKQKGCCYIVLNHLDREGYARIKLGKIEVKVHRLVYTLTYGEIPQGKIIRHLCNNPSCINPKHLAIGTDKENAEDRERSLSKEFINKRTEQLKEAHQKWRKTLLNVAQR